MIRAVLFALLAFVAFAPAAHAKGLEVGKTIPAITAKDQNGKEQTFDSLKGAKGLTIVFVRSVEWCPFCQRQVMDLSENAKKFKDAGYPVVTISYDSSEKLKLFATKFKTDLPMLSDPRSDIIKAFGIFNDNYAKGTLAYGTPFPGVYIVSADKTVKAKFFKEGVQDRPTVDELLASMKDAPALDPATEFPQEPATPVMPEVAAPDVPSTDPSLSIENAPVETPVAPPAADPVIPAPAAADVAPAPVMDSAVPPATPVIEAPVAPVVPDATAPVPAPVDGASAPAEESGMEYMPPTEDDVPAESGDGASAPAGL